MSARQTSQPKAGRSTRRFLLTALLLGVRCVVSPIDVGAHEVSERLVGFTTSTATGSVGLTRLHELCHSEFSGSRMCTTEEIVASVDPPLATDREFAWVHTTIVASSDHANSLFDVTGKLLSLDQAVSPNCDGWSYPNTTTVAITTDTGAAILRSCADANRVACCGRFTHTIFADGFEDGSTGSWSSSGE